MSYWGCRLIPKTATVLLFLDVDVVLEMICGMKLQAACCVRAVVRSSSTVVEPLVRRMWSADLD